MNKAKVSKISETESGLNNLVSINGAIYSNDQAYILAKNNMVPGYCGVKNEHGTKFIRSNPDSSINNNIEKR